MAKVRIYKQKLNDKCIVENENENINLNKDNSFEDETNYIYKYINKVTIFLFKTVSLLIKVSGIYILWICFHYFSAHLYIKFCVPDTLIGFLMSPFMIATPHCQGLRWIVYNAAGIINNMWIVIGTWIYSVIWIFNMDKTIE
jgi:hypothetical protein